MPLVQKHPLLHALQPEDEELLELEEEELVEVKHMKLELQSVPVLSQQRGVPPSMEQVGDLLASAQPTVLVQLVHWIIPLEQKQPLEEDELLEEDDDEELLEDEDELEEELELLEEDMQVKL